MRRHREYNVSTTDFTTRKNHDMTVQHVVHAKRTEKMFTNKRETI